MAYFSHGLTFSNMYDVISCRKPPSDILLNPEIESFFALIIYDKIMLFQNKS